MMIGEVGRDRGGNPVTGENRRGGGRVGEEGLIDREELRQMKVPALVYFEHIQSSQGILAQECVCECGQIIFRPVWVAASISRNSVSALHRECYQTLVSQQ